MVFKVKTSGLQGKDQWFSRSRPRPVVFDSQGEARPPVRIHVLSFLQCFDSRVGNFYPRAVLTMVKTPVKTGLGKTPKTHISWAKLGKTNFLNLRMLVVSLFCA